MIGKPDDILDRQREWAALEELLESERSELVFAVGRRRVGKSHVLSRYARAANGIYYQATRRTSREQLSGISRVLGTHFGDRGLEAGLEFPTWEAVFDFISDRVDEASLLIVIDEFPYLVDADPSLPSVIQKYWDHDWQSGSVKLILSGSFISAMSRLEAADQPLYGRRTGKLLFRPFTYREASLFTPEYKAMSRLMAYGAFGQLPGNLALQDASKSLEKNIARLILDPSSRLSDDAQMMLDAFLGDSAVYYAILQAVANGEHTWRGITRRVGRSGGSLSRPLQWLEEMGLVERVTPITEKNPAKSKRSRYRIADPYVRFWHSIVSPLASAGMLGTVDPDRLWRERVEEKMDDHMGMVFESACREFIRETDKLPFAPLRVGEWWNSSSTEQIDIVALGSNDELLVAECKWGAVGSSDLDKLRRRTVLLISELDVESAEVTLALFSGSGSTDPGVKAAIERGDLLLFNADDLYA